MYTYHCAAVYYILSGMAHPPRQSTRCKCPALLILPVLLWSTLPHSTWRKYNTEAPRSADYSIRHQYTRSVQTQWYSRYFASTSFTSYILFHLLTWFSCWLHAITHRYDTYVCVVSSSCTVAKHRILANGSIIVGVSSGGVSVTGSGFDIQLRNRKE